jgi:hypothetical protein
LTDYARGTSRRCAFLSAAAVAIAAAISPAQAQNQDLLQRPHDDTETINCIFRYNLFESSPNSPTPVVFNQSLSARGYSLSRSAGFGRAGLRAGTTANYGNVLYQPFFAVSICATPPFSAGINAGNIGTYDQYSFGINGQLANTGWLGFGRVDYRNGDHIEGWSGTVASAYQYTPGSSQMDMAFAMVDALDHARAYAKVTKTAPVFVTTGNCINPAGALVKPDFGQR